MADLHDALAPIEPGRLAGHAGMALDRAKRLEALVELVAGRLGKGHPATRELRRAAHSARQVGKSSAKLAEQMIQAEKLLERALAEQEAEEAAA